MHKILIMTNFPEQIREWYIEHGRRLPWRDTKDPYKIWISEVILQQTRVDQGLAYYQRFIEAFPDVTALAQASETRLMQLWQGLGYYSRARNLHQAAQTIVNEHNGKMPQTYKKIKNLKGIGPYTAAAIASFAYNLPHAVVDGNVYRVLSRYFATGLPIDSTAGRKHFSKVADDFLDKKDPAGHNQAIMELGALICKPAKPLCEQCPVNETCDAFATGTQNRFPVKTKRITRKKRYLHYLIIIKNQHIIINKRTGQDIWKGLYQFPLIETPGPASSNDIEKELKNKNTGFSGIKKLLEKRHLLTHQELHTSFYRVEITTEEFLSRWTDETSFQSIPITQIKEIPFPQLIAENLSKLLP
ncbi:A/G-specific adenine glycosylase [Marinilabilia salmonicolor]|uniref:Adenine DNA glycosylase n=1 Tax=Marinilabilia salmonicolor TaxID=989 RepID=A0A2T0XTB1_9BACT|nr:A/G-specific adenine glycosylase [Marinilabilia salmonicolor]PRZ02189.1 A/G-specific DNA-adenine glycosylase [Marinilabilia salmonicolor]RCW36144.1 A/G-specific DNA-adenine glycosylase [Marinilabilia salmonicolor]